MASFGATPLKLEDVVPGACVCLRGWKLMLAVGWGLSWGCQPRDPLPVPHPRHSYVKLLQHDSWVPRGSTPTGQAQCTSMSHVSAGIFLLMPHWPKPKVSAEQHTGMNTGRCGLLGASEVTVHFHLFFLRFTPSQPVPQILAPSTSLFLPSAIVPSSLNCPF